MTPILSKRKLTLAILVLAIMGGCSGKRDEASLHVRFEKPEMESLELSSFATPFSSASEPTSLAEVNCIGIISGNVDGIDNKGNCYTDSGIAIPVARMAGLVSYVSGQSHTLSLGGLRPTTTRLSVIGTRKPDAAQSCIVIDPNKDPEAQDYSEPYLLGSTDVNLVPGSNAASVTPTFVATNAIDDCDDTIWPEEGPDLSDGLLAFWNFDETTAVNAPSSSSYGSTNLIWSSTTRESRSSGCKIGSGCIQPDSDDYINTPINSTLDLASGERYTVSAWFKGAPPSTGNYHNLFATFDTGSTSHGYMLQVLEDSSLKLIFGIGTATASNLTFSLATTANTWQLITLAIENVVPSGTVKVCINTTCEEQNLGPNSISSSVANFRIGNFETSGFVDAAGIWNRVLTEDEIAELYNNGAGKQYPF